MEQQSSSVFNNAMSTQKTIRAASKSVTAVAIVGYSSARVAIGYRSSDLLAKPDTIDYLEKSR